MGALVWLDVPLFVLGLLALSLCLWHSYCRCRSVRTPSLSRRPRTATILLCFLGFGSLVMVGFDVALAEWDKAHRPISGLMTTHFFVENDNTEPRMAPDFQLPSLEGDGLIRLSDYRGHKPVVLIFGSFS